MRGANYRLSSGSIAPVLALLLAFVSGSAWSAAPPGLVPQHSEDLRPALAVSKAGAATLDFTAFGRDFHLQLSPNERLARAAAGSSVHLYKGVLAGVPGSWVRITLQDGRPRGMVWDGREMFIVDAAPESVNDGAAGTVMFKLADAVLERGVSLADDTVEPPRDAAEAYAGMVDELTFRTEALKAGVATQEVGISVLADASLLARYANESAARDAILTRLNNVDGIFSAQLGVQLQVESLEIAGALSSGLSATTDASTLLGEISQLRRRTPSLASTGVTHLLTGRKLDGNTAGIAYTVALCSPRYATSLTMINNSVALDSLIIAHEIGHVFGAPHDGVQKCAATPQGQYIMTPTLDTSVTSFSQCSLDQIDAVLASYSCVANLPPAQVVPPPPSPAPSGDGSGGASGNGGGGSLDSILLGVLWLLALVHVHCRLQRRVPLRCE